MIPKTIIEYSAVITNELQKELKRKLDPEINTYGIIKLFNTLAYYDEKTAFHSQEVAWLSFQVAQKIADEKEWDHIFFGGLLHDIGKLTFNENLFKGSSILTNKDKELITNHTIKGYIIAKEFTQSKIILDMILRHHENLDGSGYPYGLKGDNLNIYSRIIRITDMYSALTSYRIYREKKQFTILEALTTMEKEIEKFDIEIFDIIKQILLTKKCPSS